MANYMRVQLRGGLPGGEVWSVNPTYAPIQSTWEGISADTMTDVATAIMTATMPTSWRQLLSSQSNWSAVRVELRDELTGDLVNVGEAGAQPPKAGQGNPSKPFQTSCVVSIRTPNAGGRNRGRLYIPAIGATIALTTLRMTEPSIEEVSEESWNFLNEIAALITGALDIEGSNAALCVYSSVNRTWNIASYVEAGDVLDVQRRRRDKLMETRNRYPV